MKFISTISESLRKHKALRLVAKRSYQAFWHFGQVLQGKFYRIVCDLPYTLLPIGSFFGYYDKCPWNRDNERLLYHQEEKDGTVSIHIRNLAIGDDIVIGNTRAFSFQQGAMTQWFDEENVIYNTSNSNGFIAQMSSSVGKVNQTFPLPIYCLNKDRSFALSLNFNRLTAFASSYGYRPFSQRPLPTPNEDGIWSINLRTKTTKLIISLQSLIDCLPLSNSSLASHYVNHIEFNPSGERFVFFHRWQIAGREFTRMYTAKYDGTELYLLADTGMTSHYTWMDDKRLLAWSRINNIEGYYIFSDLASNCSPFAVKHFHSDGHPSFSADGVWFLSDTYPDKYRMQNLYLFNTLTDKNHLIAKLYHPSSFEENTRCDLHPRWDHSGKKICLDTVFNGSRQMCIIDISGVTHHNA